MEPDRQYLIRRSITDNEHAYYRCDNPHPAGFADFVHVPDPMAHRRMLRVQQK